MATTRELVDVLKLNAQDWNRTGDKSLIKILDEAHRLLLCQECAQRICYRTDGELPYIATTDATYVYTLNKATTGLSDDIWRVSNVLVKPPFSNQLLTAIRMEYSITPNLTQPVQPHEVNGVEYYRFYQVSLKDAVVNGYPTLQFLINPGASTKDYFLLAYKKPVAITSEIIETEIPEHLHYNILLPTALKLLEAHQNGNWFEFNEMVNSKWKPMLLAEMNKADQGETDSIVRYEE